MERIAESSDELGRELAVPPPRPLCRHQGQDYNLWEWPRQGFSLFATAGACVIVGWFLMNTGIVIVSSVGIFLLVGGGLTLLWAIPTNCLTVYRILSHASLVRWGMVGTAEVTSVRDMWDGGFGSDPPEIHYRLRTSRGQEVKGRWRGYDSPGWKYKEGDQIITIYHRVWPRLNVAYLSSLFRVSSQSVSRAEVDVGQ